MADMNQTDLKSMQTLIRLVSAGAREEDVSNLSVDWNTVLPLAVDQQVIPLVACALLYSPGLECSMVGLRKKKNVIRMLKQSNKRFDLHKRLHLYEVK